MRYFIDFPNDKRIEIECELQIGDIVYYEDGKDEEEAKVLHSWFNASENTFVFSTFH